MLRNHQTLTVTAKVENKVHIFEREILREIFGPVNIDSIRRIRNNTEIYKLVEGADIVRFPSRQKESNGWGIFKEWTNQSQLGNY